MNKSAQQLMDERMCRPGYRWNPTLKRCLGMGGGRIDADPGLDPLPEFDTPEPPPAPENMPAPAPAPAPAPSPQAPAKGKSSRGVKKVNPNGIVQTGTQTGVKGMPLK